MRSNLDYGVWLAGAVFWILGNVGLSPAWAQVGVEAKPQIRSEAVLVQVPAVVTTGGAGLAKALTAEDFTVRDNGVEQAVRLEQDGARPLSLVVVMQTGGDARLVFRQYRGLETMLANLVGKAPNEAAVVTFDSRVEGATPFTSDLSEWEDALDRPDDGDHGAAVFDGVAYALDLLSKRPAGNRHVILLISQPQDGGSKVSAKEVVRAAGESETAIYSLSFSPEKASFRAQLEAPPHLNPPLVVNPSLPPTQAYFNLGEPLRLLLGGLRKNVAGQVAGMTGGESLRFDSANDLAAAMNACANDLANRYLLTFTPKRRQPGLHLLEVRLRAHPELQVRARQTYWLAEPEAVVGR